MWRFSNTWIYIILWVKNVANTLIYLSLWFVYVMDITVKTWTKCHQTCRLQEKFNFLCPFPSETAESLLSCFSFYLAVSVFLAQYQVWNSKCFSMKKDANSGWFQSKCFVDLFFFLVTFGKIFCYCKIYHSRKGASWIL